MNSYFEFGISLIKNVVIYKKIILTINNVPFD